MPSGRPAPLDALAGRPFTPRPRQGALTLTTLAARTGSGGQGPSRARSHLTRAQMTGLLRRGRLCRASVWLGPARHLNGVQVGLDDIMLLDATGDQSVAWWRSIQIWQWGIVGLCFLVPPLTGIMVLGWALWWVSRRLLRGVRDGADGFWDWWFFWRRL